jgi:hypothetical protein
MQLAGSGTRDVDMRWVRALRSLIQEQTFHAIRSEHPMITGDDSSSTSRSSSKKEYRTTICTAAQRDKSARNRSGACDNRGSGGGGGGGGGGGDRTQMPVEVTVCSIDCLVAAQQFQKEGMVKVAVLNMANA